MNKVVRVKARGGFWHFVVLYARTDAQMRFAEAAMKAFAADRPAQVLERWYKFAITRREALKELES